MSGDFNLYADDADLDLLLAGVAQVPGGIRKSIVRALNITVRGGITDASRAIRSRFNVRAGDVRRGLYVKRASYSDAELVASINGAAKAGISLYRYSGRPTLAKSGGAATATTRRGGKYSPPVGASFLVNLAKGRSTLPGSFVARMRSGHVGIFQREAEGRAPIRERFGPDPISLLESDEIVDGFEEALDERLSKNLRRESDQVLREAGLL